MDITSARSHKCVISFGIEMVKLFVLWNFPTLNNSTLVEHWKSIPSERRTVNFCWPKKSFHIRYLLFCNQLATIQLGANGNYTRAVELDSTRDLWSKSLSGEKTRRCTFSKRRGTSFRREKKGGGKKRGILFEFPKYHNFFSLTGEILDMNLRTLDEKYLVSQLSICLAVLVRIEYLNLPGICETLLLYMFF